MKVNSFLLTGKTMFALLISASLLTASCSKEDLEYKKRRRSSTTTPTDPTTPEPAPTTPEPVPVPTTPSGTVKYLSLPESDAKTISGQSNVVIENLRFEDIDGNPLYIKGSNNITIRNCFFNKASMEAIVIENSSNVKVENCLFNGVTTGVYALSSESIRVDDNQFVNVRQRSSGGRGQFVQFNGVSGSGNSVSNNEGENFAGESDPEDLISLFRSSGTASSPIVVRNNMFRGGGPSASGGGIMSGDYGGSYQIVENNTLLDPGQYGIAAAGGSNISLLNNKIFAKQQPFTNNPLYVWAQQGAECSNITVKGNRVTWTDKSGTKNNGWNAGNCGGTSFEYPSAISVSELNVPAHLITMITPAELSAIR
ncbi:MAG: right-handed parallel beta-helix repeat-containing protein [Chitinophagaceae bacterium]|nr:MAG: right-handed parallel beta-helix repeat-containing protein [Chitinophagaceae bacterium]